MPPNHPREETHETTTEAGTMLLSVAVRKKKLIIVTEFNGSERQTSTPIPETWERFRVALQGIYHAHDAAPVALTVEERDDGAALKPFLDTAHPKK